MGAANAFWMALLLFMYLVNNANTAFIISPASQDVVVGREAEFRCRHSTADTIRWRLDGMLVGGSPPPDVTPSSDRDGNGNLVQILTIVASPQYNGSEVVCVARFDDGSPNEATLPATLRVVEFSSVNTTTPGPDFENVNFLLAPSSINVTEGEQAYFQCDHSRADIVGWLVNDTTLSVLNNRDISTISDGTIDSEMRIHAHREYNHTTVECLAFIGMKSETSSPATLLIQGTLDAVTSIKRNLSVITWEPPFSLDITNSDPDIVYCVEVYNITCGSRDSMISDCNINESSYTHSSVLNPGYIYEIAVTPRSNVDGAENGMTSVISEDFVFFITRDTLLYIRNVYESTDFLSTTMCVEVQLISEASLRTESITPSIYMLSLLPVGSDDGQMLYTTTRTVIETTTVLKANMTLPIRQLWDVVVLAYGCKENPITDKLELSTHEIQQISVNASAEGFVLSGEFVERSTAIGIFALVYSLSDESNVHYLLVPRAFREKRVLATFGGIPNGPYDVSLFTVEDNGHPFNESATRVKTVLVGSTVNTDYGLKVLFELEPNSGETGVCITCTFLDSSITDCVAVVHQQISQLSSSGLMNIESSHKFNRSGDTAFGCIEGVNLTVFQVGVIGAKRRTMQLQTEDYFVCALECIIGSAIGAATIIIIITIVGVLIGLLTVKSCTKKRAHGIHTERVICSAHNAEVAIKTEENSAYASLTHQKVLTKQNPAYEVIGLGPFN